jgi:hypothetical protein
MPLSKARLGNKIYELIKNQPTIDTDDSDDAIDSFAKELADVIIDEILNADVRIESLNAFCNGVTVGVPSPHSIIQQPVTGVGSGKLS